MVRHQIYGNCLLRNSYILSLKGEGKGKGKKDPSKTEPYILLDLVVSSISFYANTNNSNICIKNTLLGTYKFSTVLYNKRNIKNTS